MADSISERIMQNLVTTIEGVTTGNGYSATVAEVYRNTDPSLTTVTFPYVFIAEPQEDVEDQPLGYTTKLAHVTIWIWATNDATLPNKYLNNLMADIEKALLVDHTRGALAIDTELIAERNAVDETAEPFQHVSLTIDIHYRHKYGDPFSLN